MTRHLALCCLLVTLPWLAGCGTEQQPDLVARVVQDCEGGSTDACSLLRGLPSAVASPPTARPARRLRSQVQQNLDALMQGVDRARNSPRLTPGAIPDQGPI